MHPLLKAKTEKSRRKTKGHEGNPQTRHGQGRTAVPPPPQAVVAPAQSSPDASQMLYFVLFLVHEFLP